MANLSEYSAKELQDELERRMNPQSWSPVGYWKVTTEGDCEGKTEKDLGTHYGHMVDIAKMLSSQSNYSLTFKWVAPETKDIGKLRDTVNVVLDIKSGTWDMNAEDRATHMHAFFGKQEAIAYYITCPGQYYASVKLKFVDSYK